VQPRRAPAVRLLQLVLPPILPRCVAGGQRGLTGTRHTNTSMIPWLSTADLAPLLLVGAEFVSPVVEFPYVSPLILLVAAAAVARLGAREIRSNPPRVLILGSGPMATMLMHEIEASRVRRYAVA